MYKNLISPEIRVNIGNYILEEGIMIECFSSKEKHCDWCKVILADELEGYVNISDQDEAVIELGYDNDFDILMSGSVRNGNASFWKEITIKDDMVLLERKEIKATFLKSTPQDIIKYLLVSAGIEEFKLSEEFFGIMDSLVVESKPASEALTAINSYWGIEANYFFYRGVFYWGCKPDQDEIYVLEEDNNILNLELSGTLWCADTIGIPWIHHSQIIEIEHQKYSGQGEVEKVVIKSNEKGFVRQEIYFYPVYVEE